MQPESTREAVSAPEAEPRLKSITARVQGAKIEDVLESYSNRFTPTTLKELVTIYNESLPWYISVSLPMKYLTDLFTLLSSEDQSSLQVSPLIRFDGKTLGCVSELIRELKVQGDSGGDEKSILYSIVFLLLIHALFIPENYTMAHLGQFVSEGEVNDRIEKVKKRVFEILTKSDHIMYSLMRFYCEEILDGENSKCYVGAHTKQAIAAVFSPRFSNLKDWAESGEPNEGDGDAMSLVSRGTRGSRFSRLSLAPSARTTGVNLGKDSIRLHKVMKEFDPMDRMGITFAQYCQKSSKCIKNCADYISLLEQRFLNVRILVYLERVLTSEHEHYREILGLYKSLWLGFPPFKEIEAVLRNIPIDAGILSSLQKEYMVQLDRARTKEGQAWSILDLTSQTPEQLRVLFIRFSSDQLNSFLQRCMFTRHVLASNPFDVLKFKFLAPAERDELIRTCVAVSQSVYDFITKKGTPQEDLSTVEERGESEAGSSPVKSRRLSGAMFQEPADQEAKVEAEAGSDKSRRLSGAMLQESADQQVAPEDTSGRLAVAG